MKIALDPESIALYQEIRAEVRKRYADDFRERNRLTAKHGAWGVQEHGSPALKRRLRDATYALSEANLALELKTRSARVQRLERLVRAIEGGGKVGFF